MNVLASLGKTVGKIHAESDRWKIRPDSGSIVIGNTVKIGYFSQESEDMDLNLRSLGTSARRRNR